MDHHYEKKVCGVAAVYLCSVLTKKDQKAYMDVYLHPGLKVLGPATKYDISC